jgi:hypothetical protein
MVRALEPARQFLAVKYQSQSIQVVNHHRYVCTDRSELDSVFSLSASLQDLPRRLLCVPMIM